LKNRELVNGGDCYSQLSEEIKQLNEMLLFVDWKEVDLNSCFFENSDQINGHGLSEQQNDLIRNIVACIPEWKRLIGCKQHNIHDYCLDIHTLTVLKNIQKHEDFEKLSKFEKLILIYSALLHDIEKNENEVDAKHPLKGAEKSGSILYRLGFSENFINSVYLLVKYHQVLGLMASGKINLTNSEIVDMFKKPVIVDLQVILSTADIKSVKKDGSFFTDGMDAKFKALKKEIKNLIRPT
jgi:hypothetical protein